MRRDGVGRRDTAEAVEASVRVFFGITRPAPPFFSSAPGLTNWASPSSTKQGLAGARQYFSFFRHRHNIWYMPEIRIYFGLDFRVLRCYPYTHGLREENGWPHRVPAYFSANNALSKHWWALFPQFFDTRVLRALLVGAHGYAHYAFGMACWLHCRVQCPGHTYHRAVRKERSCQATSVTVSTHLVLLLFAHVEPGEV